MLVSLPQMYNPFPLNECRLSFRDWHKELAWEQLDSLGYRFECSVVSDDEIDHPVHSDLTVASFIILTKSGFPLYLRYDTDTQGFKVKRRGKRRPWTSLRVEDMR